MLMLIYELRKNWRRRVDGAGEIEGSTRGPRGPKNSIRDGGSSATLTAFTSKTVACLPIYCCMGIWLLSLWALEQKKRSKLELIEADG